jgi:MoxR-like ATPase
MADLVQTNPSDIALAKKTIDAICDNVELVLRGKRPQVLTTLIAMVAGGHVLIEDVPGVGKTLLAKALAASVSAPWRRVQFTPDLLPGDVLGISVWEAASSTFRFHPGPVFTNILLCDEINRAPEKTQAALLEAMEERQVTSDGATRKLLDPFFVIATQNPFEHRGTYSLPESQLDRFLVRLSLGYPNRDDTIGLLDNGGDMALAELSAVASIDDLVRIRELARRIHVAPALKGYITDIADATRSHPNVRLGASPRAALALMRASQAAAVANSRSFVTPDDIQALAVAVLAHRVHAHDDSNEDSSMCVSEAVATVPVPVPRRS